MAQKLRLMMTRTSPITPMSSSSGARMLLQNAPYESASRFRTIHAEGGRRSTHLIFQWGKMFLGTLDLDISFAQFVFVRTLPLITCATYPVLCRESKDGRIKPMLRVDRRWMQNCSAPPFTISFLISVYTLHRAHFDLPHSPVNHYASVLAVLL